jgi:hypothetical protein
VIALIIAIAPITMVARALVVRIERDRVTSA